MWVSKIDLVVFFLFLAAMERFRGWGNEEILWGSFGWWACHLVIATYRGWKKPDPPPTEKKERPPLRVA